MDSFRKVHVIKARTDHYVYGVVYEPLEIDSDWESMVSADVIRMAHDFISSGKMSQIDIMHNRVPCGAKVVESFIARKGDPDYAEGSWVLGVHIPEGEVWESIRSGELNGFSVDFNVLKVPKKVLVDLVKIALGDTESNVDTDIIPPHQHSFYVEFDSDGRVVQGFTDSQLDHTHRVKGTVVTENELSHNHRYFID